MLMHLHVLNIVIITRVRWNQGVVSCSGIWGLDLILWAVPSTQPFPPGRIIFVISFVGSAITRQGAHIFGSVCLEGRNSQIKPESRQIKWTITCRSIVAVYFWEWEKIVQEHWVKEIVSRQLFGFSEAGKVVWKSLECLRLYLRAQCYGGIGMSPLELAPWHRGWQDII